MALKRRSMEAEAEAEAEYNNNTEGPDRDWNEFPPDMWRCILMRLQPTQVMRWRRVSKSCRHVADQLLRSDEYYLKQRIRALSPGIVIVHPYRDKDNRFSCGISYLNSDGQLGRRLMTLRGMTPQHILPSINGLMCVVGDDDTALLCNPTTGESLTLPACPPSQDSGDDFYGFGYSPSTDEYKLVRLHVASNGNDHRIRPRVVDCSVLTLISTSRPHNQPQPQPQPQQQPRRTTYNDDGSSSPWRRIGHYIAGYHHGFGFDGFYTGSVCVDGVIYWPGYTSSPPDHGKAFDYIVSFHVRDETFNTIPSPPTPPRGRIYSTSLTELQGRLGLVRVLLGRFGFYSHFEVWMLMGPGNWIKHLQFRYSEEYVHSNTGRLIHVSFDFSCISRGKFIVTSDETKLWLIYDLKSEHVVRQSVLRPSIRRMELVSSPIQESLLSLQVA